MKSLGPTSDPKDIAVQGRVNAKQDVLVSGTNIQTINGASILTSGNLDLATAAQVGDIASALNTINGV